MRALRVTSFDLSPALTELHLPTPGPDEVQVRILACGLNFADLLMLKGEYQDTPPLPFTPGLEICARIESLGSNVTDLAVGQRVAIYHGLGGLATHGVFPAERCRPVPDSMTDAEAAGFMVAYGTSHLGLTRRARLQKGETLLVLGAAGGVGLTAVEIGKQLGARVIAVARGAEKLAIAKAAGADHLIDAGDDLTAALKALGGVDVVYDPVGGDAFRAALRACNREARILVIGFASGQLPQIPANHIMVKNVDVIGFYWGGYRSFAPQVLDESLAELMEWHAQGRLHPHISHQIPLDRVDEALDLLRQRKSTGKVVVTMDAAT